ncbi:MULTISPECIES: C45 family autoproteolytic acyltransferase/hydolase [unclassified Solwaraspora]|uniref:C45 family autoproteolytic acyltransferase/hydolase n=1 Tax=unclassified Solwaraspora TaxID=2627926 RepID=UPI00259BCC6C|nr:C45 family peptidase [Solwaraspora sp. WMMA2056]WJK42008.1 C45 family autoproteolytic acyltransferase/hydrolase [Solwaraspora sp. WMMA2056]
MADDVARHDLRAPLRVAGVPVVDVTGAPAECGAGYGVAAADLIADNVDRYLRRFLDEAGLSRAAVRVAGGTFRNASRAVHPRVTDMLDGLAEGAGVHVDEIYALNARTELLYGTRPPAAPAHPDGADGGCTAVGVLGTHTTDGHLLLGQNWDWHPDQRDTMVVLRTVDERGDAVLTLAEAGMLAKTGLNSAGLGVCVNMLGTDRDGLSAGRTPGVPYHVLLRAVLEAGSLGQATRVACRTPRNASINMLLGQAGPGGGELLDLEVVPGDVGWLHPADGVLTHANHLESALAVRDTIKDMGGSSLFRSARARRLLVERAGRGPVGLDALADVFHDHLGLPLAICRHLDERDAPADQAETVHSVLLDLDSRRLGLAAGPPCRHDYQWLELADDADVSAAAPRVPAATTDRARS